MRLAAFIFFVWCFFFSGGSQAQNHPVSLVLADTQSGYMFVRENEKQVLAPASLTKLMTLYLTFSALEKGWLKLEDSLTVSPYAAAQPRSNLNLIAGQTITVRQAILALIVKSANDVAVVLAEALGGSEAGFSQMMNKAAFQLNMKHTRFTNASGLHDSFQQTTAQDMAIMALALLKHYPQYYPLFSQKSFDFEGRTYTSHNHVLQDYEGAEGMKTGYVAAVGYNLITTAKKHEDRLLGVVMGYDSVAQRDEAMKALLDEGFHRVQIQKKAVAEGRLSPAFDPLHRRLLLPKIDVAVLAPEMPYHIRHFMQPKKTAPLFVVSSSVKGNWAIQVGAFTSLNRAQQVALRASVLLPETTLNVRTPFDKSLYRAQLTGFTNKMKAEQACRYLNQREYPCFLIQGG